MPFTRRQLIASAAAATVMCSMPPVFASNKSVKIAVGGKALYYYLPISIAESLGYFKDEGLDVEIIDFQGGSRSLQAVVGGSADVVSGAFEHTLSMQARGQAMQAFVLQGRAPQCVFAVSNKTMPDFKSMAELKGKKIGVTAPGSSSHAIAIFILRNAGIEPKDVSFIGVGASAAAVAAMRAGQIDAFVNLDPVIATLEKDNVIRIVADTRVVEESDKIFGGRGLSLRADALHQGESGHCPGTYQRRGACQSLACQGHGRRHRQSCSGVVFPRQQGYLRHGLLEEPPCAFQGRIHSGTRA